MLGGFNPGNHKRLFLITAFSVCAVLTTLMVVLPEVIRSDMLKNRLIAVASETIGGEVAFKTMELSFWPLPRLSIRHFKASIPRTATATASAISLYPALFPLLRGQFRARAITAESPRLEYSLSEKRCLVPEKVEKTAIQDIDKRLYQAFGKFAAKAPEIKFKFKNGQIVLIDQDRSPVHCTGIQLSGAINHDTLKIDFKALSNLFESLRLHIRCDFSTGMVQTAVNVHRFHPAFLFDYLSPKGFHGWTIDDKTVLNLNAVLIMTDSQTMKTCFNLLDSRVVLSGKETQQVFNITRFSGFWQRYADTATAECEALVLSDPNVSLTGRYQYIPDLKDPHVIEIKGVNADAAAIRNAVLALAGEDFFVQLIFSIVRAGHIPHITFNSQAESFIGLWHPDHFHLQGTMKNGGIHIPEAELNLKNVNGRVDIAHCVLNAENMTATLGNSQGHDGSLRLGLMKWDAPFHLALALDADLSQLPPILERVVPIDTFQDELKMIRHVRGRARGRLVLGERLFRIRPQIKVNHFELSADYERLPFTLSATGGNFSLDCHRITGSRINGNMGASTFNDLSWQLELKNHYPLHFKAGRHDLILAELFPWFCTDPLFREKLKWISSVKGLIAGTEMEAQGPFLEPHNWRLKTTASIQDVSWVSPGVAAPITITGGEFTVTPDKLAFSALQTQFMDAALTGSGFVEGYRSEEPRVELDFSGRVARKAWQWLSAIMHLPDDLNLKTPLEIPVAGIKWEKKRKIVFEGTLRPSLAATLSLMWEKNPDGRLAAKISVVDEISRATLEYVSSSQSKELSFSGYLDHSTLDGILVQNRILPGWLKGEIRAHLLMPSKISVYGSLCGKTIQIPQRFCHSAGMIEFFDVKAEADHLKLNQASLKLGDIDGTLSGDVTLTDTGIQGNLFADCTTIKWDALHELIMKSKTGDRRLNEEVASDMARSDSAFIPHLPFQGTIHLESEQFYYNDQYIWRPLQADISLDRDQIAIHVTHANLCGLSTPGIITIIKDKVSIDFQPSADRQDINHAVSCLLNKKDLITGRFNLQSHLQAGGGLENPKESLSGTFEFNASDGRIHRFNLLAKILALLNITELIRGKIPDLVKEGFHYETLKTHAEITDNSILTFSEGLLDATSLKLIFEGQVDLKHHTMDLTVLVAPFQTINFILDYIPFVGGILNDSLYIIPLRAVGDLNDPKITLLSSSGISSRLFGVVKRTVNLPFKLIRPLMKNDD